MPQLNEVGPGLWEVNFPLRLMGVALGRRMVVVRLPDGSLQLHSPGRIDSRLKTELEQIGPVREILAPTHFHDTFIRESLAVFPAATFYAPPGFPKVYPPDRGPIPFEEAPEEWREVLDWRKIEGMPRVNEHVFLHKPSRTLLVSDLVFNVGPEADAWTRLFFRLNGAFNVLRPTRIFRACIKDKTAFRASVEQMMREWDFDRLIPSHGKIVQTGAKDRLARESAPL